MKKPHFRKVGRYWVCQVRDGRGALRTYIGPTPRAAWEDYQRVLVHLERLGLRWEVFP